jgi:hypothetical protein
MSGIDEIMDMLHWDNGDNIQQRGIALARSIRSINVFIQPLYPKGGKGLWDNCARILAERPDEVLKPYLPRLLEWLQDLNWPGSLIILDRLKAFSEVKMLSYWIEDLVKKAEMCDDLIWINHLSGLLDNEKLKTALSKETLNALQKHSRS